MEGSIFQVTNIVSDLIQSHILSKAYKKIFPALEVIKGFTGTEVHSIVNKLMMSSKHTSDSVLTAFPEDKANVPLQTTLFTISRFEKIKQKSHQQISMSCYPTYSSLGQKSLQPSKSIVFLSQSTNENPDDDAIIEKLRAMKTCKNHIGGTSTPQKLNALQKQGTKVGKKKENQPKTYYQYDGNVSHGVKPEQVKINPHFQDVGVQIPEVNIEEEKGAAKTRNSRIVQKKIKKVLTHQESGGNQIFDIFIKEIQKAELNEGVTLYQGEKKQNKEQINIQQAIRRKKKVQFLHNFNIEPNRIKMGELIQFKNHHSFQEMTQKKVKKQKQTFEKLKLKQQEATNDKTLKVMNAKGFEMLLE